MQPCQPLFQFAGLMHQVLPGTAAPLQHEVWLRTSSTPPEGMQLPVGWVAQI